MTDVRTSTANIATITRRELAAYFNSPIAYIFIVVFLLFSGYMFFTELFLSGQADMRPLFGLVPLLLCFFGPAVTMHLFAEEKKQGTLEMLLAFPVTDWEIVMGKLAKRNISLKNVERGEPDVSPLGHARQLIKIKQGLEPEVAKQITGFIRERKLKVTSQIQGAEIRVAGKSRDELQSVIAAVRAHDFPVALQFQNFRD